MTEPNILSVIPARIGSKGIPRKNLRKFGDDPLMAHAIRTSQAADLVSHVVVTTDSQEIAQIGRQYGADSVIQRPPRLGADDVPLSPVIEHAFDTVNGNYDYVLCFQPTAPLVSVESLDEGIRTGIETNADSVVFVRDSTHLYWQSTEDGFDPLVDERKNRQQMTDIMAEIGVFLSHRDVVRSGRRVGDSPTLFEVDKTEGIDIDTYSDWLLAESQLGRKQLLYRVIGNNDTGTGHVHRGITIADHLFEHDILFVVDEKDTLAIDVLEESNYPYRVHDGEADFYDVVSSTCPDVVVNDVLDTTSDYMSQLSKLVPRIVNFEDLGSGAEYADAVVNALYEYSEPPENHHYGFKYFCLRNEFRYATPRTNISSVDRIMVSFGGTDENNLTARTLRALKSIEHDLYIDVVLGIGYTERESLDPIVSSYPSNLQIEINQDIKSMAAHMEQADLLITSSGRTLYEGASLNLPMVSIAQNQREQKHPYAHISRGVTFLGQADYVAEESITSVVRDYIENAENRETMRKSLEDHDIANGIDRIKDIIFEENNED